MRVLSLYLLAAGQRLFCLTRSVCEGGLLALESERRASYCIYPKSREKDGEAEASR